MKKTIFLKKLKKEGKIELIEPSEEIKEAYLKKADSYLVSTRLLLKNNLLEENKTLEQGFAKTSFMGTIGEKTQEMSFKKVKEVKYIQILEASVAKIKQNNN